MCATVVGKVCDSGENVNNTRGIEYALKYLRLEVIHCFALITFKDI